MTGGGRGLCGEQGQYGRPRFWGFGGFGRGWRNRYFAAGMPGRNWGRGFIRYEPDLSDKEEIEMLQEEANYFERALKSIRGQIDKLKKSDSEETK
jgi:hypothetical protein